jgi:hypothetical protein
VSTTSRPHDPGLAFLWSMGIHRSTALQDGVVLKTGRDFFIGVRPLTDVELAGAEGRYIVRRGLADVLKYIGETVGPPPCRSGRGDAILELLRNGAWKALDWDGGGT